MLFKLLSMRFLDLLAICSVISCWGSGSFKSIVSPLSLSPSPSKYLFTFAIPMKRKWIGISTKQLHLINYQTLENHVLRGCDIPFLPLKSTDCNPNIKLDRWDFYINNITDNQFQSTTHGFITTLLGWAELRISNHDEKDYIILIPLQRLGKII